MRPLSPGVTLAPEKAYAIFQYTYEDDERSDHALLFGTSESKSLKVRVDKTADTESGILFEVPPHTTLQLFEFWDDTSMPFRVEKFNEPFHTVPGKVVLAGWMHFKIERNRWEYGPLDVKTGLKIIPKIYKKYGLSKDQFVDREGKPLP